MKQTLMVKTTDLEEALDCLEGLSVIMRFFGERDGGRQERDMLVERLQAMDSGAMNWKPLRYQSDAGQGWVFIAENVEELRRRLLEGYKDAAP
jgi:hypothetical protein